MLSTQEIAQLIQQPKRLGATEIDQLRQLTDRFPYSQVFAILYLQSLSLAQDVLLENEIQRLAIRIQDRTVLYNLIHNRAIENTKIEANAVVTDGLLPEVEQFTTIETNNQSVPNSVENQYPKEEEFQITEEIQTIIDSEPSSIDQTQEFHSITENEVKNLENEISATLPLENATSTVEEDPTEIEENNVIPSLKENIHLEEVRTEEVPEDELLSSETKEVHLENQSTIDIDREELERKLQLERAITLQEQQQAEKQRLIDQLTIKPRAEVIIEEEKQADELTSDQKPSSEKPVVVSSDSQNNSTPKSFTSWLKAATPSSTENILKQEVKVPKEEIDLTPFAVYSLESEAKKLKETATEEGNKKKNVDAIIEKFIKEDPRITSPKKVTDKPAPERTEMYNPMKKGKESLNDAQLPVSETLAKIFVVQGNFPKAIFAYQQLMLIFPEKKTFFAKQIKELEKKLNTK